jgi:E3 SUMO-protein ligase NSE2
VHDALHPGENQPPVPHASTWFPEDNPKESAGTRRRRNNTTDNTHNAESSEDEIEMTGVTFNMKCPLTLQTFKEPYSNNICRHTFEKSAFMEYFNSSATVFVAPGQPRSNRGQAPQGTRQAKCPQSGCEKVRSEFHMT